MPIGATCTNDVHEIGAGVDDDVDRLPEPLRPVQYLGSKKRLADQILRHVEAFAPRGGVVVDLFAGSGVIAHKLSQRFDVVAVDIQRYSAALCEALLLGADADASRCVEHLEDARARADANARRVVAPLIQLEERVLRAAERGDVDALCGFTENASLPKWIRGEVTRAAGREVTSALGDSAKKVGDPRRWLMATWYFGGTYFSFRQALELDAILAQAHRLAVGDPNRKILIAAVLSTASEVVNTVGKQFAQPMKLRDGSGRAKELLIRRSLRDRRLPVIDSCRKWVETYAAARARRGTHRVVCADYRAYLKDEAGSPACVYADPPYTIDHYSRFYHVLETLTAYDWPELSTMSKQGRRVLMRGLYRVERHQSPFCIPADAAGAFNALLSGVAALKAPLVLSYSPFAVDGRPRLLSVAAIAEAARRYFGRVEVITGSAHAHRKLNVAARNVAPLAHSEQFLLCWPK